jgi:hypothetical protein
MPHPLLSLRRFPAVLAVLLSLSLVALGCDATSPLAETGTETADASTDRRGGPPASSGKGQGGGALAEVRVGHLSPDAPAVDVFVNSSAAISGLTYTNFAPDAEGNYLGLAPGAYDLSVRVAGGGPEVIAVDGFELAPNRDYTILAVGEASPEGDEPAIQALPLVDNGEGTPALPPRDKALVRFVHASPDAGAVDIAVREDEDDDRERLFQGVTFGTASPYVKLEPDEIEAIEVLKGETAVLAVPVGLTAGTKVTVYVVGNAAPESGDESLSAVTSLEATSPGGTGPVGDDDDDDDGDDDPDDDDDDGDDD